jgi:MFS family permease
MQVRHEGVTVTQEPIADLPDADTRITQWNELMQLLHRREFVFPVIGDLFLTTANNALYIIQMIYLVRNGYTIADISLFLMCSLGTYGLSLLLGGYLSDQFGFRRILTFSLLVYACSPIIFLLVYQNRPLLILLAAVMGFNSALAAPSASIYTYSVLERKQLGRMFMPLFVLSGVGWLGYYAGTLLVDSPFPFVAFLLSSFLVLISVMLFNYGLQSQALVTAERQALAARGFWKALSKFKTRKFALLTLLIMTITAGSFLFNFTLPLRMVQENTEEAKAVGMMISSAFALSMVASLLLTRVLHIQIQNIRHILMLNAVLAGVIAVAGDNTVIIIAAWACFIVISLQASVLLFTKLWEFINVKSGLEQGVFQTITTITGVLVYLTVMITSERFGTEALFLGYVVLSLGCIIVAEWMRNGQNIIPDLVEDPEREAEVAAYD